MRVVLGIWVMAVLLAGCLGGEAPSIDGPSAGSAEGAPGEEEAANALNATLPVLVEATDPWREGETERVLFEGTVQAGDCYPASTAWELAYGQYVMVGCGWLEMDEGTLIPEGASALRIEADASQALKSGKYLAWMYTAVRDVPSKANGELTDEPVHTWTFPLVPAEWDPPGAQRTAASMGFWTANDGATVPVLNGPIQVKVVVEKDQAFAPLPVLDAWADPANHTVPQPDVHTLLDTRMDYAWPGTAVNPQYPANPLLEDQVPEGTAQLAVVMSWAPMEGCPPTDVCTFRTPLSSRGYWTGMGQLEASHLHTGSNWRVLLFDVPGMAYADSPYTPERLTRIYPWIDHCPLGDGAQEASCAGATMAVDTEVRFVVEAWKAPVDLDVLKQRLELV